MVKSVIGDLVTKRKSVEHLLHVIRSRLAKEYVSGEKPTRVTLAQYMDVNGGLSTLKKVLAILYRYMPPDSENDVFLGSKRLREMNPFSSSWHHATYRGLERVLDRVKGEVVYIQTVNNEFTFDPNNYDEEYAEYTIPGMIEVMGLVMAKNGILRDKESELVRQMVIELKSDDFVSFNSLQDFINLLTFMIACKHEEAQKPGAKAPVMPTTYPSEFPPLTRRAVSLTDSYFKTHARVFEKDLLSPQNKRTRMY